jgi:voltage-gated potassium channel
MLRSRQNDQDADWMNDRSLSWAFLALSFVITAGTLGYHHIEGWNYLDSFWMVVITLTTIGFGEIHPLSPIGRVFTIGIILAGVSVGTYAMGAVTAALVEGRFGKRLKERRMEQKIERLKEHVVVVGYGRLGKAIADELHQSGVQLVVIERDPHGLEILQREERFPYVVGDGSNDEVLKRAGVERAKGMAIAVSSGAEAVFVTLSARQLCPKLNIVTRVTDAEHAIKARRAGASSVVSPHSMGGWRMAHGLIRPNATSFLDLATLAAHEDILLEEFELPEQSPLSGKSLKELRVADRFGVLIIAIRHRSGTMIPTPKGTHRLEQGDVIIVIGAPEPVRAFGKALL